MKFPVLWLSFVSLWVWAGSEKGICLAWDLVSHSRITLYFGAKKLLKQNILEKTSTMPETTLNYEAVRLRIATTLA